MPPLRGIEHPGHKLTPEAVQEIRHTYRPGLVSYRDIAERYGVSLQLIAQIIAGHAWAWVEDDEPPERKTPGALGLFFYAQKPQEEQ